MQAFFTALGLLLAYGAMHSVLAAVFFKGWMRRVMGDYRYEATYRFLYNVIAVILLAPVLTVIVIEPGEIVWEVGAPYSILMVIIQMLGLVGLLLSVLQIDGMRFLGLSQLAAGLNGDPLPLPEERLQVGGVYALVRHPLYLFSLMVLWPMPVMREAMLGFTIGSTIYFMAGSWFEERKMRRAFGDDYHHYQRRVPWFIPFIKF